MEVRWYLWAYNLTNINNTYVFCLIKNNMTYIRITFIHCHI